MGLFDWLFGPKKTTSEEPPKANSPKTGTTLQFHLAGEYEASRARCENGEVYCCGHQEYKIGFYEKDSYGNTIVWDENHKLKIGLIPANDRTICLLLADFFAQIRKNRPNAPMPPNPVLEVAKFNGSYINDIHTSELIASYQGDSLAASAAFVCLVFDVVENNKYSHLFNWHR